VLVDGDDHPREYIRFESREGHREERVDALEPR
jgi:hypothetical protein